MKCLADKSFAFTGNRLEKNVSELQLSLKEAICFLRFVVFFELRNSFKKLSNSKYIFASVWFSNPGMPNFFSKSR